MSAAVTDGLESLLGEFVLDSRERIDHLERALLVVETLSGGERRDELATLKRELHTLKGNSAMMGLPELQALAHSMEDQVLAGEPTGLDVPALLARLDEVRRIVAALTASKGEDGQYDRSRAAEPSDAGAAGLSSVRLPFAALDPVVDLLGQLAIERNRLADSVERLSDQALSEAFEALSRTLEVVRERVMSFRMTPLVSLFGSLHRITHDEGLRAGKSARLETSGGSTPLDKALLEVANEALGHLVRNAVIHGLEQPAARRAVGKSETGTVRVTAALRGDEVLIEVADNGSGIDRGLLREAADRKGIALAPDQDPYEVLFATGFSTREEADVGSGRGVGLAAVREAVRRQGGRIEVSSTPGHGTTFQLWLPLTVSVARAMLIVADGETYALPVTSIAESRRLRAGDANQINHAGVLRWRSGLLPLLDLGVQFGTRSERRSEGCVVVIAAAGRTRGLVADRIAGLREVVVKGLDPVLGRPRGLAGSTVLGDGRAILILDARALAEARPHAREAA